MLEWRMDLMLFWRIPQLQISGQSECPGGDIKVQGWETLSLVALTEIPVFRQINGDLSSDTSTSTNYESNLFSVGSHVCSEEDIEDLWLYCGLYHTQRLVRKWQEVWQKRQVASRKLKLYEGGVEIGSGTNLGKSSCLQAGSCLMS